MNFAPLVAELRRHERTLEGGFAIALVNGEAEASFGAPAAWQLLKPSFPSINSDATRQCTSNGNEHDYILGSAQVTKTGSFSSACRCPRPFLRRFARSKPASRDILELSRERKLVRRTYMGLLLLLTVLVLFASTWIALFLSKLVTRPLAALAEGTQEISKGRLDYRVDIRATDEIGDLVRSFTEWRPNWNPVAGRLTHQAVNSARPTPPSSNDDVIWRRSSRASPRGCLRPLDENLTITHGNAAFLRMFFPDEDASSAHASLVGNRPEVVFPPDLQAEVEGLIRRADRMGLTANQVEVTLHGVTMNLATTVAALQHGDRRLGYVVVFEDLSDLLKAQKQAAWREVARRVAHEIKNPLTPIALSAERIRRHLDKGVKPDEASLNVIHGCADTIANAVDTLRTLVDEFSTLARFPASQPRPASLNEIVDNALSMFNGRLDRIWVRTNLAPDLPSVLADSEAIKRAVANLVDNAAEAVRDSLVREIQISTSLVASRDAVELVIADTGHGVTHELKEKLFLPYFSTKKRGMVSAWRSLAVSSRITVDRLGWRRTSRSGQSSSSNCLSLPKP